VKFGANDIDRCELSMTKYEKLFQEQMKDPGFVKAYHDARLERMLNEFFGKSERKNF